jgi:hypothetical protein
MLGERETGTATLEESVAAYSEALKEFTRDREPFNWAVSTGNQGFALMLLGQRLADADISLTAISQINAAFVTMFNGQFMQFAAFYYLQLSKTREALFDLLLPNP